MRTSVLISGFACLALLYGCTSSVSEDVMHRAEGAAPLTDPAKDAELKLIPPMAKRVPETITQVNRTRIDPYHWMKDENWQDVM
ncbi:MAG: S9 family peptidase, partial [Pseudomonadota bacterium]